MHVSDLPHALAAAKERFNLPYVMLADPTLNCSRRYVGTFDARKLMVKLTTTSHDAAHKLNSFIGPNIGLVLIDKQRTLMQKWLGNDDQGNTDFTYPDVLEWIDNMKSRAKLELEKELAAESESNGKVASSSSANANPLEQEPISLTGLNKKCVLMVDDSSVSSKLVVKKLDGLGYQVLTAYNGLIAIEMLRKSPQKFGVVIADVMMPVCDGFEFLSLVKKSPELRHLVVVMLSGLQGDEVAAKCAASGAAGLMKKPFDVLKFQEIMSACKVNL